MSKGSRLCLCPSTPTRLVAVMGPGPSYPVFSPALCWNYTPLIPWPFTLTVHLSWRGTGTQRSELCLDASLPSYQHASHSTTIFRQTDKWINFLRIPLPSSSSPFPLYPGQASHSCSFTMESPDQAPVPQSWATATPTIPARPHPLFLFHIPHYFFRKKFAIPPKNLVSYALVLFWSNKWHMESRG
jgi:hypothetical protein